MNFRSALIALLGKERTGYARAGSEEDGVVCLQNGVAKKKSDQHE